MYYDFNRKIIDKMIPFKLKEYKNNIQTISIILLRHAKKANIRPITLHQFKYNHSTLLFNKKKC